MPKREAYDLVRHEFYKLRQREEIEKRIAVEEARIAWVSWPSFLIDVDAHSFQCSYSLSSTSRPIWMRVLPK